MFFLSEEDHRCIGPPRANLMPNVYAQPFLLFFVSVCVWRFKVGPSLAVALVGVDGPRYLLEEGRTEETVSCPEHALRGD